MAEEPFHWDLIDHVLVGLKLNDLAQEMGESTAAEERQIRFENRLNENSATVPTLLFQMHERRADEWAAKTYETYCEVWEGQGYRKNAEFVRAVAAKAISGIFKARTTVVVEKFTREQAYPACRRTGLYSPGLRRGDLWKPVGIGRYCAARVGRDIESTISTLQDAAMCRTESDVSVRVATDHLRSAICKTKHVISGGRVVKGPASQISVCSYPISQQSRTRAHWHWSLLRLIASEDSPLWE